MTQPDTLQRLHYEVEAQRFFYTEHHVAMHRAAMRVLPREECWLLSPVTNTPTPHPLDGS